MSVESDPELLWFSLRHSVIGIENSRHPLNQSDVKLKQSGFGHSHFPALVAGHVCSFEFSLAPCDITFVPIGCSDYFGLGFGFKTLNRKALLLLINWLRTCIYNDIM